MGTTCFNCIALCCLMLSPGEVRTSTSNTLTLTNIATGQEITLQASAEWVDARQPQLWKRPVVAIGAVRPILDKDGKRIGTWVDPCLVGQEVVVSRREQPAGQVRVTGTFTENGTVWVNGMEVEMSHNETSAMKIPKPGSAEAKALGCTCPITDNGNGAGIGGDGDRFGWWISGDCPLHATRPDPPAPAQEDKP